MLRFFTLKHTIGIILCSFFLYKSITAFAEVVGVSTGNLGAATIAAIVVVGKAFFWGGLFSATFLICFFSDMVEGMVYNLMWKRQYLKRPLPPLSPVRGFMEQGRFKEAEDMIKEILEVCPYSPTVWLCYFELKYDYEKNLNQAVEVTQKYLQLEKREPSLDNFKLLNAYIQILLDNDFIDEHKDFLKQEITEHKFAYSKKERKILLARIEKQFTSKELESNYDIHRVAQKNPTKLINRKPITLLEDDE